eukprot:GHVS01003267.1.p1 GENE.GHVS01003267.1~~GHVS01003267.1.p1  ORF type:complete len:137 (+),score=22.93 GHVS01003267.1:238-648(+)
MAYRLSSAWLLPCLSATRMCSVRYLHPIHRWATHSTTGTWYCGSIRGVQVAGVAPCGSLPAPPELVTTGKEEELTKTENEEKLTKTENVENAKNLKESSTPKSSSPALPEEFGYKYVGPEPTEFGDWHHKGRVSDF